MTIDQNGYVGIGIGNNLRMRHRWTSLRDGDNRVSIGDFHTAVTGTGFKARRRAERRGARPRLSLATSWPSSPRQGYGATGFSECGGLGAPSPRRTGRTRRRDHRWRFSTTPLGANRSDNSTWRSFPNGNVGIGTPMDVNGFPTATDKLQVFGDVRVGTTGTNGCLKNFAGTGSRARAPPIGG